MSLPAADGHARLLKPPGFAKRGASVYYCPATYGGGGEPERGLTLFESLAAAQSWRDGALLSLFGCGGSCCDTQSRDFDAEQSKYCQAEHPDYDEGAWSGEIESKLDTGEGGGGGSTGLGEKGAGPGGNGEDCGNGEGVKLFGSATSGYYAL